MSGEDLGKPVERLFPFVLRARILLIGRDTLRTNKGKLHFVLITEDISAAPDAYCAITPRWTGPFRLVVESARGMSDYRIDVME